MHEFDLYLFERGMSSKIPGIPRDFPGFIFPFWGDFYSIDFIVTSFYGIADEPVFYLNQREYRVALSLMERWESIKLDLVIAQNGYENLVNHVKKGKSEYVFLMSTSQVLFIDLIGYRENFSLNRDGIFKLSIDDTPVDAYIAGKRKLLKLLRKYKRLFENGDNFSKILFDDVLLTNMDTFENIPGLLLFSNSIDQLYDNNRLIIAKFGKKHVEPIFKRLLDVVNVASESHITGEGEVIDSYIAGDVTVSGRVVNSVIFKNVSIEKNAEIVDSVVMNGNAIDSKSIIEKSLLFPYLKENKTGNFNIGKNVRIGNRKSDANNIDFPSQICKGIAVIGVNNEIPSSFVAEAGSYVAPNVAMNLFREKRILKRGSTLKNDI